MHRTLTEFQIGSNLVLVPCSYIALAMKREQTAYRSLLMRLGAVLADPEPMLSRLVCGCIALAFTACVLAVACMHHLADPVKGGELSYMEPSLRAICVQIAAATC